MLLLVLFLVVLLMLLLVLLLLVLRRGNESNQLLLGAVKTIVNKKRSGKPVRNMSAITSRNGAFKSIKELLRVMKLFKDAM